MPSTAGTRRRALVGGAVDGQQAVVADADAAEQPTRAPLVPGGPPGTHAGSGHAHSDAVSHDRGDGPPVESERDRRAQWPTGH